MNGIVLRYSERKKEINSNNNNKYTYVGIYNKIINKHIL